MTKEFKENIEKNQPTIRIGEVVPSGSVNLAFVDAPHLSPEVNLEVFDYSGRVPDNNLPLHVFEERMYATEDNSLSFESGVKSVPVNNLILTDMYLEKIEDASRRYFPLYYKTDLRFYHYEKEPPMRDGYYIGQNISILEGGVPTDRNYLISLSMVEENVFRVTIFSEFTSSSESSFYTRYTRFVSGDGEGSEYKYIPDFEETLKSYPIYTNIGDGHDKVDQIISLQGADKIFATNRITESNYLVYTPHKAILSPRTPLVFRWKIKRGNEASTPWRQETLYSKDSLYEKDWLDHEKKISYVDADGKAKKLLIFNHRDAFPSGGGATYSFQYQIWDESLQEWKNDEENLIVVDTFSEDGTGPVYVYTDFNTGQRSGDNVKEFIEYPEVAVPLIIEGYTKTSPPTTSPGTRINMCSGLRGAQVSISGVSQYKTRTGLLSIISGVFSLLFKSLNSIFSVQTEDKANPSMSPSTILVDLPKSSQDISEIVIVMGRTGIVQNIRALDSNGSPLASTTTSGLSQTKEASKIEGETISFRSYTWTLPEPKGVKKIEVTIAPSKWKTRDYWWLWNLLGWRDKYRCGFEIAHIGAWHVVPPPEEKEEWKSVSTYTANVSKNIPFRKQLRRVIEEAGLVPPSGVSLQDVKYRIFLDETSGLYNNLATINLRHDRVGNYFLPKFDPGDHHVSDSAHEQDLAEISYEDIFGSSSLNIYLQVRTDYQELYLSKVFSVKTASDSNIRLLPPHNRSNSDIWGIVVNNGRFVIEDFVKNRLKDYFLPEFGMQPFSPEFPYMQTFGEQAVFVNDRQIRLMNFPLHIETEDGVPTKHSISIYRESEIGKSFADRKDIRIKDWNRFTGDVFLEEDINFTERIYADYTYEVVDLYYKGYYSRDEEVFYHLDFNPMPGHKYTDLDSKELRDSSELLTKDVYVYILPAFTINMDIDPQKDGGDELSSDYIQSAESTTLRHTIVPEGTPESEIVSQIPEDAILLGKVLVRNPLSPNLSTIIDTRRRGGGFRDDLSPEFIESLSKESGYVWDIGSWDGHPYPVNGVVVITLPKNILRSNTNVSGYSESEIKNIVEKYIALGVYPIIRCQ